MKEIISECQVWESYEKVSQRHQRMIFVLVRGARKLIKLLKMKMSKMGLISEEQ